MTAAAAIWKARLAVSWPATSAKSSASTAAGAARPPWAGSTAARASLTGRLNQRCHSEQPHVV